MTGQEAVTETQETPAEYKEPFLLGVTEYWNHGLPREPVESPSLEVLKTCLEMVLGNQL